MLTRYPKQQLGSADHGWLKSLFHFSFADYYNPERMGFGALRVVNDDLVAPGAGFEMHPHRDMEIISYVIDGSLTHGDSLGNKNAISRGHIQYMSAGTGIMHSEHNRGNETLRFLQIWLKPDIKGLTPKYGDYGFKPEQRKNQLLQMVSPVSGTAPVRINTDANLYTIELDAGRSLEFPVLAGRQAYLVQVEGKAEINAIPLLPKDALASVEESLTIKAVEDCHVVILEMKKL